MSSNMFEELKKIAQRFPKEGPIPPTAFASGVAEELRDLAAQIDIGDLVITHFSMTMQSDNKQRLEIEVA